MSSQQIQDSVITPKETFEWRRPIHDDDKCDKYKYMNNIDDFHYI